MLRAGEAAAVANLEPRPPSALDEAARALALARAAIEDPMGAAVHMATALASIQRGEELGASSETILRLRAEVTAFALRTWVPRMLAALPRMPPRARAAWAMSARRMVATSLAWLEREIASGRILAEEPELIRRVCLEHLDGIGRVGGIDMSEELPPPEFTHAGVARMFSELPEARGRA